jgi:hypothetical protein
MNLGDYLEKWGRTLFESPLATAPRPDEPPELAEIRLAVMDQVHEKSYRSGGKKVFPYDLLRVTLRGVDESRLGIFTGRFFRKYLEEEVHHALQGAGCRFPEYLRVAVEASPGLPKRGEEWLIVDAISQQPEASAPVSAARLVVCEGTANIAEIGLDKPRTNIGRVVDVYRSEGLHRRNHLAFVEDTEINRSVSREHAHILFDKVAGDYRLFNDRWYPRTGAGTGAGSGAAGGPSAGPRLAECGTWIVRDCMSQEVHRDARGFKLEHGDEIHFGQAVVRFEVP